VHTQRSRFEQLRRALDAALDAPTEMILHAVHVALHAVLVSDHVVWRENQELEGQCQVLAQALMRRLDPHGPLLLQHFAQRPRRGDDGGLQRESLEYQCPICGTRVDLAAGMRGTCDLGHVPALLVAAVGDDP
jgi:hypothetical protein